ncbi:high-affinity nicotinic acid transporter [Cladorrhinum sp. PSN259]|nr:high-affinity nicotinic acid transporter [Cladorrhinum sp. PSN259]
MTTPTDSGSGTDVDGYDDSEQEEEAEEVGRSRGKNERRRRRVERDDCEEGIPLRRSSRGKAARRRGEKGYTEEEERAVVSKFDRKLVVFVAGLYLLAFLDRSNIGNARIAGMDDDLQSSSSPKEGMYEWALTAFYIAYIAFEWMSLLWRIIPAHIYVAGLVFSWGLTASLQAVAVNYPMLIFLRTILGIGEAGFTGVPFYLSFFFRRDELAFRTAIFISAAPLATSFASSLAWLILKLSTSSPIAPWRLLFLIEGFPSILVAGLAYSIIPDSPQTAPYLTKREKKVARLRLQAEKDAVIPHQNASSDSPKRSSTREALSVLADPVAWINALILFLTNMAYSSLPVFLPTILRSMGHDSITSQALAAPPYLASFLIVLATAHASDSIKARGPLLIFHALSSAAGYTLLALSDSVLHLDPGSWVRYLAVYPAAIGFFNVVVLTITWNINNQRGETKQGAGFAFMQVIGQLGPLIGTRLYPDRDGPYYTNGMRVCAVAMVSVALLALVMRWYMKRQNARMDKEDEVENSEGEEGAALVGEKGSSRVGAKFRYML